jgi:hypothetical protein
MIFVATINWLRYRRKLISKFSASTLREEITGDIEGNVSWRYGDMGADRVKRVKARHGAHALDGFY